MEFTNIRALWPEKKGMKLERADTGEEYIFLHYLTPVRLLQNGKMTEVKPGGCIFYDRHTHQYFESKECDLLHDWFHATGDCPEVLARYELSFNTVYYPQDDGAVTKILQTIEFEQMDKNRFYKELSALKAEELFALIARNSLSVHASAITVDHELRKRFITLRSQIFMEYEKDWTVEEMAKIVNLSSSRFYSIYKSIFQVSPKKDLTNIRISHAESMLWQSELSVGRIAERTGYGNQYHFIRQFKLKCGVTPGQYRKNCEQNQ